MANSSLLRVTRIQARKPNDVTHKASGGTTRPERVIYDGDLLASRVARLKYWQFYLLHRVSDMWEYVDVMTFRDALTKEIKATIRRAKRDGTVGMSLDNLRQCVKPPSYWMDGAPQGTNCQYYYAVMFAEICGQLTETKRFVRNS